ncbi:MAG: magnesium/cobalt transporter CorA [Gemmatimonadetes bacterium]|nr:magnesium/cobalt transporter CorA [Gemmatimonadota bacterium]
MGASSVSSSDERTGSRKERYAGLTTAPRKIVGRLVKRATKKAGAPPGTLVHTGERKVESVLIRLIDYDADNLVERTLGDVGECFTRAVDPSVTWVNIDGLHEVDLIERIGDRFGFNRLALEDVLSPHQRPKVEDYEDHFLVVLKMLYFDAETESVLAEQVSFLIGPGYLFSFQERQGDVFEPIRARLREGRTRIRSRGTDYLAYALIDAIVDSYFRILEAIGDRIEEIEESVLADPTMENMHRIHHLRREMLVVRRAIWPLRESLGLMYRGEVRLVTDETQLYLRDVYDHAVQVIDTVETLREVLSGALDMYMSGVSNRMNEVMKVLTIIATIFIPLSFFAGLYGMNFEYMPELGIRWAYPTLLSFMTLVALGMLLYFRKKDWL